MNLPPQISTQPIGPSATFVERVWLGRAYAERDQTFVIEPDGRVDVVLAFDDADGHVMAFGSTTRAKEYQLDPSRHYLGIRFKPGKSRAFLDIDPGELLDDALPVDRLGNTNTNDLLELAVTAWKSDQGLCRIVQFLDDFACPLDHRPALMDALAAYVDQRHGMLTVENLARQGGLSIRQLERRFNQHVGMSPKLYARIVRYGRVRETLDHGARLNADLAARFGYTDQSHLWRDFHAFARPDRV